MEFVMRLALFPMSIALLSFAPAMAEDAYIPPEDSGLIGIEAYPDENGACERIGENDRTVDYMDDTAKLVGCLKTDTESQAARLAEGGTQVAEIGDWVLFSIPD
jgi:hypothetical protein